MTQPGFAEFIKAESAKYARIVDAAHITAD